MVSFWYGYEDSPDAEVLTPCFNVGKGSGAVGVGRHGNYLQWGFSASPANMTEAGKCFFLNCICYIHKFDGFAPLVHVSSSERMNAVRLALLLDTIKDPRFQTNTFPADLRGKFTGNPEGLAQYYQERIELIYRDRVYLVDEDLPLLGLKSNHTLETLKRLIELLDEPKQQAAAGKLLRRYTSESFETAKEWRDWFDQNRQRIFFTDVGGYKFIAVTENYPIRPGSLLRK